MERKLNLFDAGNAFFECVGATLVWFNVRRLYRDKMLRGVNWQVSGFFWAWGIFNIFWYTHLDKPWSFAAGLIMLAANTAWITLALKYRKN